MSFTPVLTSSALYANLMIGVAVYGSIGSFFQAATIYRAGRSDGVSVTTWIISVTSNTAFVVYALMKGDLIVLTSSCLPGFGAILVLIMMMIFPSRLDNKQEKNTNNYRLRYQNIKQNWAKFISDD